MDIFRALTKGAKFDLSRFSQDASRFELTKSKQPDPPTYDPSHYDAGKIRQQNQITVHGQDVPDPITDFHGLQPYNIPPKIFENLNHLQFTKPTPVQMQAIPIMMNRNLLVCAPTGSGKTLSFVLPIISSLKKHKTGGPRALILAPTRELATQIFADIKSVSVGISLRTVIGSSRVSNTAVVKRMSNSDILVTTPNRLLFAHKNFRGKIDLSRICWIVADECDKLFQPGERGFREQFGRVFRLCTNPGLRKCFFSATVDDHVAEWCRLNLEDVIIVYVGDRNSTVSSVDQQLVFVGNDLGKLFAIRQQFCAGIKTPALIFVESKNRADELFDELQYDAVSIDVLHSGRSLGERDDVVERFRTGRISVLIATDLVARGMDFSAVNFVINYDVPKTAVDYIHRIGRTGRAGRRGESVTYYTDEDLKCGIDQFALGDLFSIATVVNSASAIPEFLTNKFGACLMVKVVWC